jgi:hypothetical protein
MIEIIPFKPEHPRMMENPRNQGIYLGAEWMDTYLDYLPLAGPAYTGLLNDKIVGCAGIMLLWPGVAEAWMLVDHYMDRYPVELHKTMKTALTIMSDKLKLHRLQAMVSDDSPAIWKKWMSRLGFCSEGVCAQFGPNREDFERFAKVWR